MNNQQLSGKIIWINGPVIKTQLEQPLKMSEQVFVGEDRLMAEVIEVKRDQATLQVYEETTGVGLGEPVYGTGQPLSMVLGPGLIGKTFDGTQRPLDKLYDRWGIFIERGETPAVLDPEKKWQITPAVKVGEQVHPGTCFATTQETKLIEHRLLVPPSLQGEVVDIIEKGPYSLQDTLLTIKDGEGTEHAVNGVQRWPVRSARPVRDRKPPVVPLVTGQRVIDTFFPIAKGGTASIPGPFGSGKTVTQHNLAKWSDADIIIYVGCGERGNEMTQVLEEFPKLKDPWSGQPLMDRTILIANTSNMPVAARESSIYSGLTMAEYYRDQGYDVALMADSTSRWAEALREISGRLEEMPAEEGFPAYLPSRLAAFYERAGRVETLGGREGSVTIVGAVSPPGGDFSEPVTRHTQRFTRCFWALDRELASKRHYPSINWLTSYSLYKDQIADWWQEEIGADWLSLRNNAMQVLQKEADLQHIVELVGAEALADQQRWILTIAQILKEGFLQQNAFNKVDAYSVPKKQIALLSAILNIYEKGEMLIGKGIPHSQVKDSIQMDKFIRLKSEVDDDQLDQIDSFEEQIEKKLKSLEKQYEIDAADDDRSVK